MATTLLLFRPPPVRCAAAWPNGNPDRKRSSAGWWTPLFGWSSEPDYIDSGTGKTLPDSAASGGADDRSEADLGQKAVRSRFSKGCFTQEKAKQLRMMTMGGEAFHDAMYHSAIASRLASEISSRSDL